MERRWYEYPKYKPMRRGRYLVTFRRPTIGKWVGIRMWEGHTWEKNDDVAAWMRLPERYQDDHRRRQGKVHLGKRGAVQRMPGQCTDVHTEDRAGHDPGDSGI